MKQLSRFNSSLKGGAVIVLNLIPLLPTFDSFPSKAILLALLPRYGPRRHVWARPTRRVRLRAGSYLFAIAFGGLEFFFYYYFRYEDSFAF